MFPRLPLGRRTVVVLLGLLAAPPAYADSTLLNVSYDPTRELYQDYNQVFAAQWKAKTGETLKINQSHGGSGSQALSVINGLDADVVTLGVPPDVDAIAQTGLIAKDWMSRLPNNSAPYTSTVAFLVRKGNPKQIKDWGDLVKPGIQVITPNPKLSGTARLNYIAAWGYALKTWNGDEGKARAFVTALFGNVPVLDSGGRAATNTFAQRGIGDVLIAWENEAILAMHDSPKGQFEIVMPSFAVVGEPSVAVVDKIVDKHKTRAIAEAYLQFLYTPEGQEIVARNYYRPRDPTVAQRHDKDFPKIPMVSVESLGGWPYFQATHFKDGGVFDQLLGAAKR